MGMRAVQAIAAVWLLSLGENFDHATAFLRAKDKAPLQTVERSFPDHIIRGLTENFNSMKLPQLPSDTDRKLVLNGRMSDANRHGYVAHLSFPIIGLNWAGALISENLVLSTGAMLCSEEVGIGIQNLNMTATFGQGEDSESGKIINCVAHPRFNETGDWENDLALFLLDDELSDNLRQNPVKLGCNSEHKKSGNIQSLSWEYSSNRNPNDESFLRLSKGLYKLMNKKKCMEMLIDGKKKISMNLTT
uniref:Peptidase S1 domain-containing protein n=2 Tax=Corethron hystrix TaxID=216773 RepID=A0A7S1B5A2_9STRA|mmetsp:Transcript_11866/g.26016  ORF Transcript_11866/g.26016 Transcript_11866/m.26016 type:complete len:247 (+) Transcript_11866:174-914(+)